MRALEDRASDDVAVAHCLVLPVAGVPTTFETNDARVAAAVAESFGAWRVDAADFTEPADERLTVRVFVVDGEERADAEHAPVLHHLPDAERLIVQSPGSIGVADSRCRRAVAWVTGALVDDAAHFRAAVLEALTLALLSGLDRHPLHAAAVAHDGRALLLAGPSGAGKSTLTLAAHLDGLDVMSEDRVWIQLAPRLRVWGSPGELRLVELPSALDAPLAFAPSTRDGKTKVGVRIAAGDRWCSRADRARVCLIGRERAPRPRVERLSPEAVAEALTRDVAPGFDRFPERHGRVVAALAAGGGWRLVPSADARESVPLLREMLGAD